MNNLQYKAAHRYTICSIGAKCIFMKKLVLSALLLAGFAFAGHAQKGSVLLYGNVGISTTKEADDDKYTTFQLNPGVGYQFTDNWTAGVNLNYGYNKANPSGPGASTTSKNYGAGLFARYTKPLGGIFSLFGQANAGYVGTDFGGNKTNGFGIEVFPAVALNVHNGFALNFSFGSIGFESTKAKGVDGSNNDLWLNFGQQVNFGVSKNFGGKK